MRTGPQRKLLGGSAALLLLAGGLGTAALLKTRENARAAEQARNADSARGQAMDVLKARLSLMEGKATAAASLPVLRAQLGVVDANTLRDGFRTEPWWQRVREAYPIYGISMNGSALDVLEGSAPEELNAAALLKTALEKGQASAVLPHGETPLLAATASIERPGLTPVLLVARPLDVTILDEMAARAHGAVLVNDGKTTLLAVGPAKEREHLALARGAEGEGLRAGDGWVAAAAPLGPGLWLWVHGRGAPEGSPVTLDLIAVWILCLGGAGVLAVLALRKPAQEGALDESPDQTTAELGEPAERDDRTPADRPSSRTGTTGSGATNPSAARTGPSSAGPRASTTNPGAGGPRSSGVSSPGRSRTGASDPNAKNPRSPATTGSQKPVEGGPQRFGRYWLIDRLGEGGMAEVYLALAFGAESFRRTFVLKRLRGDAVRTEALVNMFIDEAKIASSLIHGNIIPVFDFGKVDDEYFIAQEYILGRDLRRVTTRVMEVDGKPLPARFTVFIMKEVLRALDYAHAATGEGGRPLNLVHRDVSPNNVLVSARGEVKLFDFGIAKADEGRLTQTQTGTVKGNIKFMSPEQARGENVDQRADLGSLGLVFYFALTGQTLYEGDTGYVLLMQAAMGLTPETEAKIAALPPELAPIVRKSIAPREERYQTAAEFEQALAELPAATGSELRREMDRLFGADLKAEEKRFANVQVPSDDGDTIQWGTPEGGAPPGEDQPA